MNRGAAVVRDPSPQPFRLGQWAGQIRGDEIAALTFGDHSVLRAVRFVVWDRDWRTIPVVTHVVRKLASSIVIEVGLASTDVVYAVTIELEATDRGLAVRARGVAGNEFLRNRIGLVVLHHPDDAGTPARVLHPDGSSSPSRFPAAISPHQPFTDVAALSWRRGPLDVELRFEGDVFETEDQRNWSDASFKAYSTPLSLPFPVQVYEADVVVQQVTVTVRRTGFRARRPVKPFDSGVGARLPELSTQISPADDPHALRLLERVS